MRDLAILCILACFIGLTLHRPWLGVLGLTVLSYLNPHAYSSGFMKDFPVYAVLFVCVAIAVLKTRERRMPPFDWRLVALLLLWGYFLLTTSRAAFPWGAEPMFLEVSKVFLSLLPVLILIDTREKLFFLMVTITLSFALVTLKGGYWAVLTGFSDRVYGPPGTRFHGNNLFAVAIAMNIPLLVLWMREIRDRYLRGVLMATIALSYIAVLTSWSRGGLLALGTTTVFLLLESRRKLPFLLFLLAGIVLLFAVFPEKWFMRMETLATYAQDQSAIHRLEIWKVGFDYALEHPFTGAGFEGWRWIYPHADHPLDWHSAYVQIMAEHGLIAFGIWMLLFVGTLLSLSRLAWQAARLPGCAWVTNYATMLRTSLMAYGVGSLFLNTAYWDLLYQLMIIAVLLTREAHAAFTAGEFSPSAHR